MLGNQALALGFKIYKKTDTNTEQELMFLTHINPPH